MVMMAPANIPTNATIVTGIPVTGISQPMQYGGQPGYIPQGVPQYNVELGNPPNMYAQPIYQGEFVGQPQPFQNYGPAAGYQLQANQFPQQQGGPGYYNPYPHPQSNQI